MDWGKLYPILNRYKEEIDVEIYKEKVASLMKEVSEKYSYNNEETTLVIKDILYNIFLENKKEIKKQKELDKLNKNK